MTMQQFVKYFDYPAWLPEGASTFAAGYDNLFNIFWVVSVIIFFLTYGLLGYFLYAYRARPGHKAVGHHGNNVLEFTWTILPTFLFAGLGIYADGMWELTKKTAIDFKPEVEVQCIGMQFQWMYRYAGADGKLGSWSRKYMSTDNLFGRDPNDPAGKDDFESSVLHLPINKNILVNLTAVDVLHSFFLPHFRVKQDAVPGSNMRVWFNGIKAGNFEVACAELCGSSHYNMKGKMVMHSQADFNAWYDAQVEAKAAESNPAPTVQEADTTKIAASH